MNKHKRRARAVTAGLVPAAAAAAFMIAGGGSASAAPSDGPSSAAPVEAPSSAPVQLQSQGAVTTPAPSTQGAVTSAPEIERPVPLPAPYSGPTRPLDGWDYESNTYTAPEPTPYVDYATPVDYSQLHLPTPVEVTTLPIEAPRDKMRFGRVIFDQPNWVPDEDASWLNRTSAGIEAAVTDGYRSVGVETTEAERLAAGQVAGTVGGTVGGALAGCTAVGVPAALAGGTIGGIGGALLATWVPTPIPGVAQVTSGVAGTAAGAAIGAGLGCAGGGLAGGALGGTAGFVAGSVFGAGEDSTPVETQVSDIDQPAITDQVEATVTEWRDDPATAPVAAAVTQVVTVDAPAIDAQVRDFVAAQPGGDQVIAQVDSVLTDFFGTSTPGVTGELVSTAVADGVTGGPAA